MRTSIKLLKSHIDNGRKYSAGDVLEVTEENATWLVSMGVAESFTPSSIEPAISEEDIQETQQDVKPNKKGRTGKDTNLEKENSNGTE